MPLRKTIMDERLSVSGVTNTVSSSLFCCYSNRSCSSLLLSHFTDRADPTLIRRREAVFSNSYSSQRTFRNLEARLRARIEGLEEGREAISRSMLGFNLGRNWAQTKILGLSSATAATNKVVSF